MMSLVIALAMLAASHTAVSVASCDYCKVRVIAEVQSDALDKVAVNEASKSEMIVADSAIHIDKVKADSVITASFGKANEEVDAYAAKEKTTGNVNAIDDAEFTASVFRRFDQTAKQYELATNTLISIDSASVGSRQASRYKQASFSKAVEPASGTIAEGGQQPFNSGDFGERASSFTC